jgi:hypothetical protein
MKVHFVLHGKERRPRLRGPRRQYVYWYNKSTQARARTSKRNILLQLKKKMTPALYPLSARRKVASLRGMRLTPLRFPLSLPLSLPPLLRLLTADDSVATDSLCLDVAAAVHVDDAATVGIAAPAGIAEAATVGIGVTFKDRPVDVRQRAQGRELLDHHEMLHLVAPAARVHLPPVSLHVLAAQVALEKAKFETRISHFSFKG